MENKRNKHGLFDHTINQIDFASYFDLDYLYQKSVCKLKRE